MLHYAVVDKSSGVVGGYQALRNPDPLHSKVDIGAIYWGPGIARRRGGSEAFYLFVTYVFDTLGYNRFGWRSNNQNTRSTRAASRFGFTFEGIARVPRVVWKGYGRDMAYYSMLLDVEWPLMKKALELWLLPENFDEAGMQRERLEDVRRRLDKLKKVPQSFTLAS